jgi:hypothetical protein
MLGYLMSFSAVPDPAALEKSSLQVMIAPLAPTLPPLGVHCDASVLPERVLYDCVQVIRHNRNRGMPMRRGQSPKERHNKYQMISPEQIRHETYEGA